MRITRAVITAAGQNQRTPAAADADRPRRRGEVRPGHPRRGGARAPASRRSAWWSGRATRRAYARAAGDHAGRLHFVAQPEPLGLRPRRLLRARVRRRRAVPAPGGRPPLRQPRRETAAPSSWSRSAQAEACAVSAVQATRESLLPHFGAVGGRARAGTPGPLPRRDGDREADAHRGRAAADRARPARRPLPVLLRHARADAGADGDPRAAAGGCERRGVALSPALAELARREQYLALEEAGRRYDIGARYGLLTAQLALALSGARPRRGAGAAAWSCWPCARWAARRARARHERARRHHHARPIPRCATARSTPSAARPSLATLLAECAALDRFRRAQRQPLRARARAVLPLRHPPLPPARQARRARGAALIPFDGYEHLLHRRFEEAIDDLPGRARRATARATPSPARWPRPTTASASRRWPTRCAAACAPCAATSGCSASATRPTTRCASGRELLRARRGDGSVPDPARDARPVRMDLTHSGWSDIFFLGMDFPEGARVLNVSIDLARARPRRRAAPAGRGLPARDRRAGAAPGQRRPRRHGRHHQPGRGLRLRASDYLGLLKAAVIASGIVPPGIEGSGQSLADLLARIVGPGPRPGDRQQRQRHPQGLAPGGFHQPAGRADHRLHARHRPDRVAHRHACRSTSAAWWPRARILGEWLGGSGGGWQDSGGVWPGMKLIEGVAGRRGRPRVRHQPRPPAAAATASSTQDDVSPETRRKLQDSLVLVHGGMAQNVGPILEMVTEKYLLRSRGRVARRASRPCGILDEILAAPASAATSRRSAPPPRATSPARSRRSSPGPPTTTPRRSSTACAAEFGDGLLGLLDAGRHVRRRHGLHLRPGAQGARRRTACRRS